MLREKDVFDIAEVETAIVEANGAISVLKKTEKNAVTRKDMNIVTPTLSISFPIIMEGIIKSDTLEEFNLDEVWLKQQLTKQGIDDISKIFSPPSIINMICIFL